MKYDRNDHGDFYIEEEPLGQLLGSSRIIVPVEEYNDFYKKVAEHYISLLKEKKIKPVEYKGVLAI